MFQNLLQEADAADGLRLPPPSFAVSRILAPVSLCAGLRNLIPHLRIDHADKMIQLGRNFVVSFL
jgi:hypothetical protein